MTEAAADPDINSAISSAVSSASEEVKGGGTDASAEASEPETDTSAEKQSEAKEAATPDASDIDFYNPTAEDLEVINQNPQLLKVYKSMQRGLTKKTQSMAAEAKTLRERAQLADWIQSDPEKAIRALAAAAGVTVAQVREEVKEVARSGDPLDIDWDEKVGKEAAAILRPLFESTIKDVLSREIAPLRSKAEMLEHQAEEVQRAAAARGIAASVREFGASIAEDGGEWDDEVQEDMAKLANAVAPGDDTDITTYLKVLYNAVTADRARTRNARANLERLKKAQRSEPVIGGRPGVKSEERVTSDMNDKDAVALAVKLARGEIRG